MATITGTADSDTLNGTADNDWIRGGDGNDLISGGDGADTLDGEAGANSLSGGAGNDTLWVRSDDIGRGDDGDDWIYASATAGHTATAYGGDGLDNITIQASVGGGSVVADAGAGDDRIIIDGFSGSFDGATATVTGGAGRDFYTVSAATYLPPRVTITDFTPGDQGDRLHLVDYLVRLSGYNWGGTTNPFAAGLVRVSSDGTTTVQVHVQNQWYDLFVLPGVAPGALTASNFDGWPPDGGAQQGLQVDGTPGDDSLAGSLAGDTISAGGGNDAIDGRGGNDLIFGGDGNDTLTMYYNGAATLHGGAGDDRLAASGIVGGAYYGEEGNDTFSLFDDQDVQRTFVFDLGDGNDVLDYYGRGAATILGGAGDDRLTITNTEFLNPTDVLVDAGSGSDSVIIAGGGHHVVTLGQGADTITIASTYRIDEITGRGTQVDVVDFNPAEDRIAMGMPGFRFGVQAGETVVQAPGGDRDVWQTVLHLQGVALGDLPGAFTTPVNAADAWRLGDAAADTLAADAGIHNIDGGAGDDQVLGSAAADLLRGAGGNDSLSGLDGYDSLDGGRGDDTISGGAGADTIVEFEGSNYLRGDAGDDQITGGYQFDDINGNQGNDTISGGAGGDDWLVGGQGNDLISATTGGNILYGNLGNDTLHGGSGTEILRGGQGDDSITAGAGNDFISGDRGSDTVSGGAGADIFHTSIGAGVDRVTDFDLAEGDRVMVDPGTTWTVSQVGADTVIDMGNGDQMILVGVQASTLTGSWIFGA